MYGVSIYICIYVSTINNIYIYIYIYIYICTYVYLWLSLITYTLGASSPLPGPAKPGRPPISSIIIYTYTFYTVLYHVIVCHIIISHARLLLVVTRILSIPYYQAEAREVDADVDLGLNDFYFYFETRAVFTFTTGVCSGGGRGDPPETLNGRSGP